MDQNQQLNQLLDQANQTIKSSDQAIQISQKKLAQLKKDVKKIDQEHAQAQAEIDADIEKIVQDMDYQTAKFIKNTE